MIKLHYIRGGTVWVRASTISLLTSAQLDIQGLTVCGTEIHMVGPGDTFVLQVEEPVDRILCLMGFTLEGDPI